MKLMAKLAYSQLIVNRSRTIWTLVGITLSTALITAVSNFVVSGTASYMAVAGERVSSEIIFTVLLVPAIILSAVIISVSVITISNGFRVSAGERAVQFGILKSVGATKKQIAATVMYEGVLLSVVGIPVGIILGLGLSFVGVQVANHYLGGLDYLVQIMIQELHIYVNFVVSLPAIFAACVMSFVTILISAYRPARKASRATAINSIRSIDEVKHFHGKRIRTNPLISKIFGFEGTLAAKFLKRNRRNFRSSLISLTAAVILFVIAGGVGTAVGSLERSLLLPPNDTTVMVDYISARFLINEEGFWEPTVVAPIHSGVADIVTERLRAYDNTRIFGRGDDRESYSVVIPAEFLTAPMMEVVTAMEWRPITAGVPGQRQEYLLSAAITTIDPYNHKILRELAGVPEGSNILLNHFAINDRGRVVVFEPLYTFEGQYLQFLEWNYRGDVHNIPIHGVLVADQLPPELYPVNPVASVVANIIVPYGYMRVYNWLATPNDIDSFMAYANSVMAEMFPREDEDTYMGLGFTTRVFLADDFIRLMNLGISVGAVFVYSFVGLLTLVGLTCVVSTLYTNVRMRSQEFAVLQSVGMTLGGIKRMLILEGILCSLKSLFIAVPVAVALSYFVHLPISNMLPIVYQIPWVAIVFCVVGVFAVTCLIMWVAVLRLRGKSIADMTNL
ncbi:MAG: ABC transporter permease [Defluviitaleaceae bacterium]|nr:ABC transporter permease [Defluviitaleaceae bacterium]